MLWLLITLLLLLSLAALGCALVALWRRVKVLGRQLTAAGATVEELTGTLDGARAAGPLGVRPCPTCGAPPRAVGSRPPAVQLRAR